MNIPNLTFTTLGSGDDRNGLDRVAVMGTPLLFAWGSWLAGAGSALLVTVVAAMIALVASVKAAKSQQDAARKDQWWDRLKWAIELALSPQEAQAGVGMAAIQAMLAVEGFDNDELHFLLEVAKAVLLRDESGTLDVEEDSNGNPDQ